MLYAKRTKEEMGFDIFRNSQYPKVLVARGRSGTGRRLR